MTKAIPWGSDLVEGNGQIALENMSSDLTQGGCVPGLFPGFNPANIVVENGEFYATIYACKASDETHCSQSIAIWLSSLRESDVVHLTVSSLVLDIQISRTISLLAAIASTKAQVKLHLDTIVTDGLAYFYLLVPNVVKGTEGAIFIPSYVDQRDEDMSGPARSIHDFFALIVDGAVSRGRLTADEAQKLHRGSPVVLPDDRF